MLMIFAISLILPFILMMMNLLMFKKAYPSREKISPFECGFDPKILPRNSFSMKFYLIAIIFLVFDIEIALILPSPIINTSCNPSALNLTMMYFLLILMAGLFYEWKEGGLNWLN